MKDKIHPAFPRPVDLNCSIWRYLDFDKFIWMLQRKALYMPRADQLGDAFEGSTTRGHLAQWKAAAEKEADETKRRNIEGAISQLSDFAREFLPMTYVSCWHMSEVESHAMWKLYTKSSMAVAIASTFGRLENLLPDHANVGIVRYVDFDKYTYPTENLFHRIMHKRHFFSYEQEVRAVVQSVPRPPGIPQPDGNHFEGLAYMPPVDPRQLVTSVVIHPDASVAFATHIEEICATHGLPKPIVSGMGGTPTY